jgi:hypothetical protein
MYNFKNLNYNQQLKILDYYEWLCFELNFGLDSKNKIMQKKIKVIQDKVNNIDCYTIHFCSNCDKKDIFEHDKQEFISISGDDWGMNRLCPNCYT